MEIFYSKISKKKFKIFTFLFCFLGDLLISSYLYSKFNNFALYEKMLTEALKIKGLDTDLSTLPPNFIHDQFQFIINSLIALLGFVILLHLIFYIFNYVDRKFAQVYITVLIWVGAPSSFFIGITRISSETIPAIGFIVQSFLYLFIILGVIYFSKKSVQQN